MGSNDWTCPPREHDFAEVTVTPDKPLRLYCRRCGWVREPDTEPKAKPTTALAEPPYNPPDAPIAHR